MTAKQILLVHSASFVVCPDVVCHIQVLTLYVSLGLGIPIDMRGIDIAIGTVGKQNPLCILFSAFVSS